MSSAAFFILLAVAGNDTTRTAISLGMHLLGENPGQRAAWQSDPEQLTASAVEEIVRVASPVTFMRRTAARPVVIAITSARATGSPCSRGSQP